MEQIKIGNVKNILDLHFKTKNAVMLLGPPGIGKSEIVRQFAIEKAKELNREFVDWFDIVDTPKEEELLKEPQKFFLFVDLKLYEYEPQEIKGLTYLDDKNERAIILPWDWMKYFSHPDSAGVIFLDELNLANTDTIKIAFKLIYQRVLANRRIKGNVLLVAAGNPADYNYLVIDLPLPLRDRMGIYYVYTDFTDWLKWAVKNKIHPLIIKFLTIYPNYLYYDKGKENNPEIRISTPRSWHLLSNLIKELEKLDTQEFVKQVKIISSGYLHPEVYVKFTAFIDAYISKGLEKLVEKYLDYPEKLFTEEFDIEKIISFVSLVSSLYVNKRIDDQRYINILKRIDNISKEIAILMVFETIDKLQATYSKGEELNKFLDLIRFNAPEIYTTLVKSII